MRQLLAIIFIVLLVVLPSCKFFKNRKLFKKKTDITVIWKAKQDSIRVADSLKSIQDHMLSLENARLDSLRKADEAKLALESKFNIIVGSFITPQYAIDFAKKYRELGYEAKIIKMEGSRFELVSAESHNTFREAALRLKSFQDTVQIESWIYSRK